jgi:opacity protein-like surface antigen
MKKVYLLGAILATTVSYGALADTAGVPVGVPAPQAGCPKAFQGFHLGGNVGYGIGWGKKRFNASTQDGTTGPFTTTYSRRHDLGVRGFDGGIGVGYTHRVCNWALGLVFDANWANTSGKASSSAAANTIIGTGGFSTSHKAKLRNTLQLYGKVAYVLREIAAPFVALGWENAQWKASGTTTVGALTGLLADNATADGFNPAGFSRSGSKSKRLNAFMWKAGVDFLATRHVIVGVEYTGSIADSQSFTRTFQNPQTGNNTKVHGSFKPQYNKVALTARIIY